MRLIASLLLCAFSVIAAPTDAPVEVPEASTWIMMTMGLLLVAMSVLRQRKTNSKNRAPEAMR